MGGVLCFVFLLNRNYGMKQDSSQSCYIYKNSLGCSPITSRSGNPGLVHFYKGSWAQPSLLTVAGR